MHARYSSPPPAAITLRVWASVHGMMVYAWKDFLHHSDVDIVGFAHGRRVSV